MLETDVLTIGQIRYVDKADNQEPMTGTMEIYVFQHPYYKPKEEPTAVHRFVSGLHRRAIASMWHDHYAKPYYLLIKPD